MRAGPVLLAFPARAGRRVFQHDAARVEVGADGVGAGEIAGLAGRLALGDARLDLVDRHGRALLLGAPERQHAQHAVALVARGRSWLRP